MTIAQYLSDLTGQEARALFDSAEVYHRDGSLPEEAPLRYHAREFMGSTGAPVPNEIIAMTLMAGELYRLAALSAMDALSASGEADIWEYWQSDE